MISSARLRNHTQTEMALSAMSIGWILEDGLVVPEGVRRKLTVPKEKLLSVLAFLTLPERNALKKGIRDLSRNTLPGPWRAGELCEFLDAVAAEAGGHSLRQRVE